MNGTKGYKPGFKPASEEMRQLQEKIDDLTKKLEKKEQEDEFACDICRKGKVSHDRGDNFCPSCGARVDWEHR